MSKINTPSNDASFDKHEHHLFTANRRARLRVPLAEAWRGCVGLAAMIDDPDRVIRHGRIDLVPNSNVTWLAVRDVPVRGLKEGAAIWQRDVCLATTTKAQLHFGKPRIDFTRASGDSWDLRSRVFEKFWLGAGMGEPGRHDHLRASTVLNRLDCAMTQFAYCTVDRLGHPVRPAWFHRRGQRIARAVANPRQWAPTAYLAFRVGERRQLFEQISGADHFYPIAFREQFCNAVARGLSLASASSAVYCGTAPSVQRFPLWIEHQLLDPLTGRKSVVCLTPSAKIRARTGQVLSAGEIWCHVLNEVPAREWLALNRVERWKSLPAVFGSVDRFRMSIQTWMEHQVVTHADLGNHQFLLPAELCSYLPPSTRPIGLFWDLAKGGSLLNPDFGVALFPPLHVRHWHRLRFNLPGDIDLDASIIDARCRVNSDEQHVAVSSPDIRIERVIAA